MTESLTNQLDRFAAVFNDRLSAFLPADSPAPAPLRDAMRYALLGPGKRLRPFLVTRCCEIAGGTRDTAFPAAVAVELIHTYSLVHDDLPAMDDDDIRRGRPTTHKQYGEAVAILAGDALLTLAFETLVTHVTPAETAVRLVTVLAGGAGWQGMIAGQTDDVLGENEPPSIEKVRAIHRNKTAALFEAACRMGAVAGSADAATIERLATYGREMGLAFQITDDLLDVTGTEADLGKRVGKDASQRKQTYPACVGIDESLRQAGEAAERAVAALAGFDAGADDLRALARYAADRAR